MPDSDVRKVRYKVADISLDSDGNYWLTWYGAHPDQGGMVERWGSAGTDELEGISFLVRDLMAKNDDIYKRKLRERLAKEKDIEAADGRTEEN